MGSRARALLADAAIVVAVASLRVVVLALDGQVLARSDLGTMFVPNYAWWWSSARWLGGWNRWVLAGYPAGADPLYGQLHPLGLFYAVLPALDAMAVETALAPALAGIGMLVYLRGLGCDRVASLAGALSYSLGGFVGAHAVHPPLVRAAAAVPWALAAVEACAGARRVAALAAAVAAILLAGHPQVGAYGLALVALYALWRGAARGFHALAAAAAGLALGVVVAAGSWLPAIGLVGAAPESIHGWTALRPAWSGFDPRALFVGFPRGGSTGAIYGADLVARSALAIELLAYPGMVAIVALALAAPALARERVGRFWIAVGIAGAVLASGLLGTWPPLAGVRAPSRWILWWNVAAAVGAALALRAWRAAQPPEGRGSRWWLAAAVVAAALATCAFLPDARRSAAIAALAALAALLALRGGGCSRRTGAAIVLIAALDLAVFASAIPTGLPRRDYPDPAAPLRWLGAAMRAHLPGEPHARALVVPELRYADTAPFAGVALVQGYSRLVPADLLALLAGPRGRTPGAENRLGRDRDLAAPANRALDLLRVRLVVCETTPASRGGGSGACPYAARAAGGDARWQEVEAAPADGRRLFVNRRALPVAWLVQRVRALDRDAALRLVRDGADFDPLREALVAAHPAGLPAASGGGAADAVEGEGAVAVAAYGDDEIRLVAAPSAASLLVTSELAAPGWTATIDGRAAELLVVNAAFRGVVVPPGRHEIALRHRPASARLGLALSAAGALAVALLAAAGTRARRRGGAGRGAAPRDRIVSERRPS